MADKNKSLADSIVDELLSGKTSAVKNEPKDISSGIVDELLGTARKIPDLPSETTGDIEDVSTTKDILASLGSGALRGVVGLPGVPGSLEAMLKGAGYSAQQKLAGLPEAEKAQLRDLEILGSPVGAMVDQPPVAPQQTLPTYEDVISATAGMLPESVQPALTYEPKTAPGRIARTTGEFTGGALFPGSITRNILRNVAPWTGVGAATGVAEEVVPGAGGPVGLALTVPTAILQSRKGKAAKLLGATQAASAEAKALQAAGESVKVPLTAAETIADPRLVSYAEEAAKQPKAADTMRPFIEAREAQIPAAIERGLLEVAPPIDAPLSVSRQASEAASKAVSEARGVRSEAVDALYKRAKTQSIETSDIEQIVAFAEKEKLNRSPAVQKEIDEYIKQFFDKDGNPITNLGALDDIYATTRDAAFIPVTTKSEAGAKKASGAITKINNELKAITNQNDDLRAARELFESESEKLTSIVGDTGVESIVKSGSNPNAVVSAITGSKARAGTIKSVADQLNKQDKKVFPNVARYWLEESASAAIRGEPTKGGYRFEKSVRGSPLKQERFDAIIAGVARAKDKNPENAVKGANKLMDVLAATAETKGLLTPSGAVAAPGTKFGGIIERLISKFERATDAKFYNQFAEALVSDDSIAAMERLARTNATRDAYAAFLNTLIQPSRGAGGGLLAEQ